MYICKERVGVKGCLSGGDHWPTFGFLPAELNCLTLIVAQSVGFCDVSEGNVPNTQNGGKMVTLGTFSSPWAH